MNFTKCHNCVGKVELSCDIAREAAKAGIKQMAQFDEDIRIKATEDIAARVGGRIIENGCSLTLEQVKAQIIQQPVS